MNRRNFLKVITALVGGASAPVGFTKLVDAEEAIPAGFSAVGLLREAIAYDLYKDTYIVRYDILTADGKHQFGVDQRLENKDELPECREMAKRLLEDALKHEGLTWGDLQPLPPLQFSKLVSEKFL